MKTINKFAISLLLLSAGIGFTGCDSFLEEYSQDLAKVESWEDLDEVLLGNVYASPSRIYVENYNLYMDGGGLNLDILHFMSDEMQMTNEYGKDLGWYDDLFAFYTWQMDTGVDNKMRYVGGDDRYWNSLYERINVCNMILSLIDEQPENFPTDAVEKERVKGEASFMRGLFYFMLTNLYAKPYDPATAASTPGMPIKFTEFVEDREFERETLAETYGKILEDLNQAEKCLENKKRKSRYRVDVSAVRLLLSRVWLYMQNWEKAAEYAEKVLTANNTLLTLAGKTPGQSCLDASCPEILFFMGDYNVSATFADDNWDYSIWKISDDMYGLYTDNDYRKNRYIGESQYNGQGQMFRKVNGQREAWGSYFGASSIFTFRTSEAYLNLAEASAYAGNEAKAKSTLERFLRTRMSSEAPIRESGNALIDFIRDERARELLLEGHRWFDLRRYTVCQPYPWSKEIDHNYCYFDNYSVDYADWYRLEKNDEAYTLPVPREIRSFQNSLEVISRPARTPYATSH